MAQKKESFFWTSYSDLMTSLFFVMLVLFILVIVLLHKRIDVYKRQLILLMLRKYFSISINSMVK